jgi:hypothetical protein
MAGRQNGSTEAQCGDAVARCVRAYRDHLANLAEQPLLERAYERVDLDRLRGAATDPATLHEIERAARRARRKTSDRALPRFTEARRDGDRRIVADPPLITRPDDAQYERLARVPRRLPAHGVHPVGAGARRLPGGRHRAQGGRRRVGRAARLHRALRGQQQRRRAVPAAQAGPRSVVARFVHGDQAWHAHQGQRVVEYQKALQTVTDPLLGWTTVGDRSTTSASSAT